MQVAINWTIVELKCGIQKALYGRLKAINWTIVELKFFWRCWSFKKKGCY